jgi:hypothetical protein
LNITLVVVLVTELPSRTADTRAAARMRVNIRAL